MFAKIENIHKMHSVLACAPFEYTIMGGIMGYISACSAGVFYIDEEAAMFPIIGISGYGGAIGGSLMDHSQLQFNRNH